MGLMNVMVSVELIRDGVDAWIANTSIVGERGTDDSFEFAGHPSEDTAYYAAATVALLRWQATKKGDKVVRIDAVELLGYGE